MTVKKKDKCPQCASQGKDTSGNNLAINEDGYKHCFACDYKEFPNSTKKKKKELKEEPIGSVSSIDPLPGVYTNLKLRKIKKETCQDLGILYLKNYCNQPTLAFEYYLKNSPTVLGAYHIKPLDKNCSAQGNQAACRMWGSKTHSDPHNKILVVTEGHEDAACLYQILMPSMFHVTSLPHGTGSVDNFIKWHYETLNKYKAITLSFDNRPDGDAAVDRFIHKYNQIGRIKVARFALKDANDMVKAGREEELKWAIIKAETFTPSFIKTFDDIIEDVLEKPKPGIPWPWHPMTAINHGFYPGKTYYVGSATDVGKSTWVKDLLFNFMEGEHKIKAGAFFLEHKPAVVGQKLLSSKVGYDLEQPDTDWWDKDEIRKHAKQMAEYVYFYDPTQGIKLHDIISSIYYFVNVHNIKVLIIDNLTILGENREINGEVLKLNEFFDEVGKQFNKLKRELGVSFIIIGHLDNSKIQKQAYVSTSPKRQEEYMSMDSNDVNNMIDRPGMSWERGRVPTIESLHFGATVAKLADEVWVLARDTTNPDDVIRRTTRVKNLKCKNMKRGAKREFDLIYNPLVGKLEVKYE